LPTVRILCLRLGSEINLTFAIHPSSVDKNMAWQYCDGLAGSELALR